MKGPAPVEVKIETLLSDRRSPYAIDPNKGVSEGDMRALMEAARWSASAYNAQPWRYVVGVKGRSDDVWQQIHDVLADGNKPWTANAPVLVLTVVNRVFAHNGKANQAAEHDMGLASAQLTVEATARNLVVHQMVGINFDDANAAFSVQEPEAVFTALAIGYQADASVITDDYAQRDAEPRQRKTIDEMLLAGSL